MELFFADPSNITSGSIKPDVFEQNHIKKTLRKQVGDIIYVTDGNGSLYKARISELHPNVELSILEMNTQPHPLPRIHLAVGFIRFTRLEFILEKATELGICDISLLRTQFSNFSTTNTHRFDKILRQAIKQSHQYFIPSLEIYPSLEHFIKKVPEAGIRIVAVSPEHPNLLNFLNKGLDINQQNDILLVIGPEGGFSESEIDLMDQYGFVKISLGNTRLRTETAAISGLSILHVFLNQHKENSLVT